MTTPAKPIEMPYLVDDVKLRQLIEQSAAAPRKRSHLLMHSGPDDQVQRMLIAAQPGTYGRPHRHSRQWEMLVLQRGRMDILTFKDDGEVLSRNTLDQTAPVVQIPVSEWHTCIVREPDTVVVEIKPGPYRANEFAQWAPEEGHERAAELLRRTAFAKLGQKWQPA